MAAVAETAALVMTPVSRAVGTVPEARLLAFKAVMLTTEMAAAVPVRLAAGRAGRAAPEVPHETSVPLLLRKLPAAPTGSLDHAGVAFPMMTSPRTTAPARASLGVVDSRPRGALPPTAAATSTLLKQRFPPLSS